MLLILHTNLPWMLRKCGNSGINIVWKDKLISYTWGKRNIAIMRELEARLNALKVTYGNVAMDKWQSFVEIFGSEKLNPDKKYTMEIEGNNCRLRHRIRWIVRKTHCFSKKLLYHFKTFDLVFHYINYGFVWPSILFRLPPDADWLVKDLTGRGSKVVIPPRSNRKAPQ